MSLSDIANQWERRNTRDWTYPSWWNLLITFPWAIGLVFSLYSSAADRAIADRQRTTYGIVRTHEPANHDRYGYEFVVNGKFYTGWQSPTSKEFRIGQQVLVYYDPADPTRSALNSFAEAAENALGPFVLCTFGILAVAIFIFVRRQTTLKSSRLTNGL